MYIYKHIYNHIYIHTYISCLCMHAYHTIHICMQKSWLFPVKCKHNSTNSVLASFSYLTILYGHIYVKKGFQIILLFFCWVLRPLHLVGRCFITWAIHPGLFALVCFPYILSLFCLWSTSESNSSISTSHIAGIIGVYFHACLISKIFFLMMA